MEAMRGFPDDAVDLIVTSPPYNNWRNRRTQADKSCGIQTEFAL